MILQTWGDAIVISLQEAILSVTNFVPALIGALIIFFIGWIVAVSLGKVVEHIIDALHVDELFSKLEVGKSLEKAGVDLEAGALMGALVKWFLIIVFLLASVNILGLNQVSDFLRDVLLYIPNIVVAAFIIIIAALVSDVVEKIVRASAEAFGSRGPLVGVIARWAIWVFAFVAVLLQLGIAPALVQTLMTGLVAAVAIALGLAFGLGGRDVAASFLERVRNEIKK